MAVQTKAALLTRANSIRQSIALGAVTPSIVGGLLRDMIDSLPADTLDFTSFGGVASTQAAAQSSGNALALQNTAALQSVANAANGGALVRLPPGDFWFDKGSIDPNVVCQLNNINRVTFAGAGPGATRLHLVNGANSNFFNLTGASSYISFLDMELDGNRLNQDQTLGVSAVRGDAFSGLWMDRLYIHDIVHYGIGFEGFVQQFIFMNNIKLENLGGDGFDQKNRADADLYQCASNIEILNFGLNLAEVTQAGWDCRGAWQLKNFTVYFSRSDGSGIRFRQGNAAEPAVGFGGHYSHLTNFEIVGPGPASTASGIECVARDVHVKSGRINGVLYGAQLPYDSGTSQGAERCTFDSVTAENYGTAGFITSDGSAGNTFTDCTANGNGVGAYGFRIRSADCTINTPRAFGNVTSDISLDTTALRTHITQPRLTGTGSPGAAVVGLDVNANDCKCVGGDISGHVTNASITAARFKAIGTTFRSATTDNVLVAAAATDAEFTSCTSTGAASEGLQVRGARTTWRGGEITSNGGLGVQTEASATDTLIVDPYMTGNAADFDDQGAGTVVTRSRLISSLVNQAVASGGTSSNIDVPVLSGTTVLYMVEAVMEDSTGGTGLRCTQRTRIEVTREGSGTPTITGSASEFAAGSGLTVNSSITGNSLRVNVTKAASGTSCRMDIRVFELRRMKTVVFT